MYLLDICKLSANLIFFNTEIQKMETHTLLTRALACIGGLYLLYVVIWQGYYLEFWIITFPTIIGAFIGMMVGMNQFKEDFLRKCNLQNADKNSFKRFLAELFICLIGPIIGAPYMALGGVVGFSVGSLAFFLWNYGLALTFLALTSICLILFACVALKNENVMATLRWWYHRALDDLWNIRLWTQR